MNEPIDDFVEALTNLNGVEKVHIETTISVTHRKQNTGKTDDSFNEIRERIISEEEFETVAEECGVNHHGTVDVIGDYYLKDRFSHRCTIEGDNQEGDQ